MRSVIKLLIPGNMGCIRTHLLHCGLFVCFRQKEFGFLWLLFVCFLLVFVSCASLLHVHPGPAGKQSTPTLLSRAIRMCFLPYRLPATQQALNKCMTPAISFPMTSWDSLVFWERWDFPLRVPTQFSVYTSRSLSLLWSTVTDPFPPHAVSYWSIWILESSKQVAMTSAAQELSDMAFGSQRCKTKSFKYSQPLYFDHLNKTDHISRERESGRFLHEVGTDAYQASGSEGRPLWLWMAPSLYCIHNFWILAL